MTESIFVPFVLETKEACEKAFTVLTSEPTPWPKSDATFHMMNRDEVADFFKERREKARDDF